MDTAYLNIMRFVLACVTVMGLFIWLYNEGQVAEVGIAIAVACPLCYVSYWLLMYLGNKYVD